MFVSHNVSTAQNAEDFLQAEISAIFFKMVNILSENKRDYDLLVEETEPRYVRAPGECWKKIPLLAQHIQMRGTGENTTVEDVLECYDELSEVGKKLVSSCYILWRIEDDGDFHVEEVMLKSTYELGIFLDSKMSTRQTRTKQFVPMNEFMDALRANQNKKKLVSSAVASLNEAIRINGSELTKGAAQEQLKRDLASTPSVSVRMSNSQINGFSRYVGMEVVSQQRTSGGSDHIFLQAARELVRNHLNGLFPHNKDGVPVMHIGCTMQEISAWWSHRAHSFSLHLTESKDSARFTVALLNFIQQKLTDDRVKVSSNGEIGASIKFKNLEQAVDLLNVGRERVLMPGKLAKASVLFFQDSLYDIGEADFLQYFEETGAVEGYATLFIPDQFITNNCTASEIYDTKYYYAEKEALLKSFEKIWPEILLAPILAGREPHIIAYAQAVFTDLLDKADRLMEVLDGLSVLDLKSIAFLLSPMLTSALDLAKYLPIVLLLVRKYFPKIVEEFTRISVIWKNGFSDGYDHKLKSWKKWATKRRMFNSNICVDSEIVTRYGEMYLIKFYVSNGESPKVTSLRIPEERVALDVMDVFASYSLQDREIILDPKYFKVRKADWFKLLNFCLDQDETSLSFAMVCTALNRIRGGLSLGSRVLAEEMPVRDSDASRFAMACYLESIRMKQTVAMIEADASTLADYKTNAAMLWKKVRDIGGITLTLGLSIPIYYLAKWLMELNPRVEFVKKEEEYIVRREPIAPREVRAQTLQISLQEEEKPEQTDCYLCDSRNNGMFTMTDDVADGQAFYVHNHTNKPYEYKFDEAGVVSLIEKIKDAEEFHAGTKAEKHIQSLKRFVKNFATIDGQFKLDVVIGGGGTGKSVIARAIARDCESRGEKVVLTFPFKDLAKDYTNCRVIGSPSRMTFNNHTLWWAASEGVADVLIVDEISAVEWVLVLALAKMLGVKTVIVCGDQKQTKLNTEAGEGICLFDYHSDWETTLQVHELVYNYRLDAWRVKLLNRLYGYKMVPKRSDEIQPKFVTRKEYLEDVKPKLLADNAKLPGDPEDKVHLEMVFAHESGQQIFGNISSPAPGGVNMSVRSKQGKTVRSSAISATLLDVGISDAHGMLNVAISRSTHDVYFVADLAIDDAAPNHIRETLKMETAEEILTTSSRSCEPPVAVVKSEMTAAQKLYSPKMEKLLHGLAVMNKDGGCLIPAQTKAPLYSEEKSEEIQRRWILQQFHTCLIDPLLEQLDADQTDAVIGYLLSLWEDDGAMGRLGMFGIFARITHSVSPALEKRDGKYLVPLNPILDILSNDVGIYIQNYHSGKDYFSEGLKKGLRASVCLRKEKNHVVKTDGVPRVQIQPSKKGDAVIYARVDDTVHGEPVSRHYNSATGVYKLEGRFATTTGTKKPKKSLADVKLERVNQEAVRRYVDKYLYERGLQISSTFRRLLLRLIFYKDVKNMEVNRDMAEYLKDKDCSNGARLLKAFSEKTMVQMEIQLVESEPLVELVPQLFRGFFERAELADDKPTFAILVKRGTVVKDDYTPTGNAYSIVDSMPFAEMQVGWVPDYDPETFEETEEEEFFDCPEQEEQVGWFKPEAKISSVPLPVSSVSQQIMDQRAFRLGDKQISPIPAKDTDMPVPKLKFGTNCFLHRDLIDPSGAVNESRLNYVAPALGPLTNHRIKRLDVGGFIFEKTKAGKLKRFAPKRFFQINPGMSNHFDNTPMENLISSVRYGKIDDADGNWVVKPKLDQERKAYCQDLVNRAFRSKWKADYQLGMLESNWIVGGAQTAAIQRNYHKRAVAGWKQFKPVFMFNGKAQVKPVKNGKLDPSKGGQGIMQTPPGFNLEWISWSRLVNFVLKDRAQDHLFMDDREDEATFQSRVSRAVRNLPDCARVAILDAKEFDSQQNEVTLYIERLLCVKLGFRESDVLDFQKMREPGRYKSPGQFSGNHSGEKGSGFLDTKSMNTALELVLSTDMFKGKGPLVEAGKGDDYFRAQACLEVDVEGSKKVKTMTGMKFEVDVADGGEFIGCSVSRKGFFPSITRTAMKTISAHVRDEKHFAEMQISLRDKVLSWKRTGEEEVIHMSAYAEKAQSNYVRSCLGFVESISHLSWRQFKSIAKRRKGFTYIMPQIVKSAIPIF